MRSIDIHAHLTPQSFWKTVDQGNKWHGVGYEAKEKPGFALIQGRREPFTGVKQRFNPEERIKDMDQLGVDVQVVSIATPLFGYYLPLHQGRQLAREVNDEISSMTRQFPQRFAGLATLPMQNVKAAVEELDRSVNVLGLKGAELDTVVNGKNWDEPEFLPLFQAAEAMGVLLFFHPQPNFNLASQRINRYAIGNSIGPGVEETLLIAALIFGGILDRCPDLKVCVPHGGGYSCFGMGRMERGWRVRSEARVNIPQPPSTYQRRIYYDCITMSEPGLRFLLDSVGSERVVMGSDWPYVTWDPSPVAWINGLKSLSQEEKESILWRNLEGLLGI